MDLIFFFDYNMMLLYVLLDVLQFDYDMKEDILIIIVEIGLMNIEIIIDKNMRYENLKF